jgi:hypothetical protein
MQPYHLQLDIQEGDLLVFVLKAPFQVFDMLRGIRRGGSTLLRLTNANHAVAQYGTLELVYDGANWCAASVSQSSLI